MHMEKCPHHFICIAELSKCTLHLTVVRPAIIPYMNYYTGFYISAHP